MVLKEGTQLGVSSRELSLAILTVLEYRVLRVTIHLNIPDLARPGVPEVDLPNLSPCN